MDVLVKLWLVGDEYWRNPIPYQGKYESMVSLESRRYMRGENGTESLMVC